MQYQRREKLLIGSISIVAVLIACWFFNPFPLYFLNDDLIHIPLSRDGVLFQRNSMRPLADLSVRIDYLMWGKNAAGYHFTNLLLHIISSVLVYLLSVCLLKRYFDNTNTGWQSLMATVLFFVYAFHSETIFWILGRSGSLGTLFFIPAVIFYLRRNKKNISFILSGLFFTCGLFAYESVWIFPLIAIIISIADHKQLNTTVRKDVFYISIIILVFIAYLFLRVNVINEVAGNYEAAAFYSGDLIQLAGNFFRLMIRCFIPPVENKIILITGGLLLLILVIMMLFRSSKLEKRNTSLILILSCLLISFVPYLSLGISTHQVEGERYLYMPSIFACLLLVTAITSFSKNTLVKLSLWIVLLFCHLYFLYQAKTYYSTASTISKKTYQQINLLAEKKRLFIDSLPQSVNGALVFRLGFDEGVQWLKDQGTVDSIFVVSVKTNNENWQTNYQTTNPEILVDRSFDLILVRDTTHRQTYIFKKIQPVQFNQQTDAWFVFKNNSLEIIK